MDNSPRPNLFGRTSRHAGLAALIAPLGVFPVAAPSSAGRPTPDVSWTSVVAITRDGHAVLVEPDGTAGAPLAIDGADQYAGAASWNVGAASSSRVLASSDYGQHAIVDPATGESVAVQPTIEPSAANAIDGHDGAVVLLSTLAGSDEAVVVDLEGRPPVRIAMGAAEGQPSFGARADSTGAVIAIADLNTDETHVLTAAAATVVAGSPVAVTSEWVATVQHDDDTTTVQFFAPDGTLQSTWDSDGAWKLVDGQDGTVIAIDETGTTLVLRPGLEAPTSPGKWSLNGAPTDAFTTLGGERVVVTTPLGVEVFDRDGTAVGEIVGNVEAPGAWPLTWPQSDRRCAAFAVAGETSLVDLTVIDTESGAMVSEDLHPYAPVSADGCTFREQGTDGGITLVRNGEQIRLADATSLVGLSPDGRTALVEFEYTSYQLVDLDDPAAPPTAVNSDEQLVDAAFVTT